MVAQHALGTPLGLTALELVFAAEARELGEPDPRLLWTEKLDLFDARAIGEKRLDHASLIEHFQHRRLKARPARFMMRRRPLFDDPRPYAMTQKLARGEKARGTRADADTGSRVTEWFGKRSFIADMGRLGRRVLRLSDPRSGRVLLGEPFSSR
jgi:hypothetical protein